MNRYCAPPRRKQSDKLREQTAENHNRMVSLNIEFDSKNVMIFVSINKDIGDARFGVRSRFLDLLRPARICVMAAERAGFPRGTGVPSGEVSTTQRSCGWPPASISGFV
ncbi:hypothetical protein PPTG_24210 [Phytophthora nicotianae INRA-310]|uniref:Uncharacterized protein n=1 Tax=Phytophthora nicotianae (strain INRA-310) TaxID=761204 RepID=W2PK74_PHYN3|nr:hypothetical protein PPTG_24210 [Phytophthora nicotianae INRA-310]ETN00649.1 hypothetical protein PPTG_24210 [Phytophthora nicotianae INRA-310]